MDVFSSHSDITVQARTDLGILIVRWLNNTPPTKVKDIYLSILDHCMELSFDRVLIDVRRREQRDTEIVNWFFSEYIEIICGKLDNGLKLSFLVAPLVKNVIEEENRTHYQRLMCKVSVFDLEQDAFNWLVKV